MSLQLKDCLMNVYLNKKDIHSKFAHSLNDVLMRKPTK